MLCPSCGTEVEASAWFCPVCAHQLHEDVAAPVVSTSGAGDTQRDGTFVEEVSRTIAWAHTPEITAEALIVGEVSEVSGPARTFHGTVSQPDGSTPSFTLYTHGEGSILDDPTLAPRRTSVAPGPDLSPYEHFVYEEVDGQRTLGEIQSAGLLAPTEIQVSLLTLLERGLITLDPPPAPAPLAMLEPSVPAAPAPLPTLDPSFLVELTPTPTPTPPLVLPLESPLPLGVPVMSPTRVAALAAAVVPSPASAPPLESATRLSPLPAGPAPPPALARASGGLPAPAPAPASALAPRGRPSQAVEPRPSLAPAAASITRARPSEPPAEPRRALGAEPGKGPEPARPRRAGDAPPLGPRDVRLDKARELYAASMVDRAGGNLVSARMNLKLAVAFDPENVTYQEAFAQLGQAQLSTASVASNDAAPTQRPAAQKAYDEGCAAEAAGDVDRAVRLFEAALRLGEDPLILNRLGVVLAMRRSDVRRGQQLLERAVALAPMNPVYTHNLSKVLGLAAARVVDRGASTTGTPKGKGGFWKRLLGR
jgi:hypothetical protein